MQHRSQDVVYIKGDSILYYYVCKKRNSNGKIRTIENVKQNIQDLS